jgi:hypothetical protein
VAAGAAPGLASKGRGARCRLGDDLLAELDRVLDAGPAASGWEDQRWTLAGIRDLIAANIAADLTAWIRLLSLHDDDDLRDADPDTLRYRIWHIPARPARHARRRTLAISQLAMGRRVPHLLAAAHRPPPHPHDQRKQPP